MKRLSNFFEEKKEDTSKPHPIDKNKGADDQEYLELMYQYKKERRQKDIKEADKILDKARKLADEGDVSDDALTAAAYL